MIVSYGYFIMQVKVLNNCIGCGACSQLSSEVFDISGDYAVVNPYKIEGNENSCIDAAIACPVGAVKIIS